MRRALPPALMLLLSIALATAASAERILIIAATPGGDKESPDLETRQFRDELGMVVDDKEVMAVTAQVDFFALTEAERYEIAADMCVENEATAAVWLEKTGDASTGVGLVAVGPAGKVARRIDFETPMPSLTDIALLTMELIAHTEAFARSAAPAADGWIPLPSENPPDAPAPNEPEETPERTYPPLGEMRDIERPWAPPTRSTAPRTVAQIGLRLLFSRGIAGYLGPSTWLGGRVEGIGYPAKRLLLTAAFSAEAGPRFQQDQDRVIGYRLRPALGLGLAFTPGKIRLAATVDAVLSYTDITTNLAGYPPSSSSWWSFVPTIGVHIGAPTTARVSFGFEIQLAVEANGMQIQKETDTGAAVFFESPILSLQLAAGIDWSFSVSRPAAQSPQDAE